MNPGLLRLQLFPQGFHPGQHLAGFHAIPHLDGELLQATARFALHQLEAVLADEHPAAADAHRQAAQHRPGQDAEAEPPKREEQEPLPRPQQAQGLIQLFGVGERIEGALTKQAHVS